MLQLMMELLGHYTVKVQFIVDKTGAISNVQAIEKPSKCPSCASEAEKLSGRA
jgi:predicted Zn-ribbon and HTH transcriptional regulator